jgi:hypothetical protein
MTIRVLAGTIYTGSESFAPGAEIRVPEQIEREMAEFHVRKGHAMWVARAADVQQGEALPLAGEAVEIEAPASDEVHEQSDAPEPGAKRRKGQ